MSLLHAGVDTAVIALWLGHADIRSTNAYLHADMAIKQKALDLTTPAEPHRCETIRFWLPPHSQHGMANNSGYTDRLEYQMEEHDQAARQETPGE